MSALLRLRLRRYVMRHYGILNDDRSRLSRPLVMISAATLRHSIGYILDAMVHAIHLRIQHRLGMKHHVDSVMTLAMFGRSQRTRLAATFAPLRPIGPAITPIPMAV